MEPLEERALLAVFNPLAGALDGAAGSLRAAILAANTNAQNDTINLQAGTYALSLANVAGQENLGALGDLDLRGANFSMTFLGAGQGVTIINGADLDRVFHILPNVNVTFRNLTITNGTAVDNGTASAAAGSTEARGGGILKDGAGRLTLDNVGLTENIAAGGGIQAAKGGGLFAALGLVNILNGTSIGQNQALGGGGGRRRGVGDWGGRRGRWNGWRSGWRWRQRPWGQWLRPTAAAFFLRRAH